MTSKTPQIQYNNAEYDQARRVPGVFDVDNISNHEINSPGIFG